MYVRSAAAVAVAVAVDGRELGGRIQDAWSLTCGEGDRSSLPFFLLSEGREAGEIHADCGQAGVWRR